MNLGEQIQSVNSRKDFMDFVVNLSIDLEENEKSWVNTTLESFLEAIVIYLQDNFRVIAEQPPTWSLFAKILYEASRYPIAADNLEYCFALYWAGFEFRRLSQEQNKIRKWDDRVVWLMTSEYPELRKFILEVVDLRTDFAENGQDERRWPNPTLDMFLDAITRCMYSAYPPAVDRFFPIPVDPNCWYMTPSWGVFSGSLGDAQSYE